MMSMTVYQALDTLYRIHVFCSMWRTRAFDLLLNNEASPDDRQFARDFAEAVKSKGLTDDANVCRKVLAVSGVDFPDEWLAIQFEVDIEMGRALSDENRESLQRITRQMSGRLMKMFGAKGEGAEAAGSEQSTCPVVLDEKRLVAVVNRQEKELSRGIFNAVKKLVTAYPKRIESPDLGPNDPRYFNALAKDDSDWRGVLLLPNKKKGAGFGLK